jgi:hypothetical protein
VNALSGNNCARRAEAVSDKKVQEILEKALKDAQTDIPSEEITYTEMMEYLAQARREAEKKRK